MPFVSATSNTFAPRAVSTRRTGLLKSLFLMMQLANERRALARLDADALTDIGVSRTDALNEARRPVWDAPDYWHK